MEKILISACLVGDKTKYDGSSNYHPLVRDLLQKYELVPFCPECEGGLPTPRKPSERTKDGHVINNAGKDVTKAFHLGAEKALNICKYFDIKVAILKERSPSCGKYQQYDGTFTGRKIKGEGVTCELLRQNGIKIYNEEEIEELLKE